METYLQSSWSLEDLYPSQKSVEMQLALADLEFSFDQVRAAASHAYGGHSR